MEQSAASTEPWTGITLGLLLKQAHLECSLVRAKLLQWSNGFDRSAAKAHELGLMIRRLRRNKSKS
jgi:hypothetical protein